MRKGGPFVVSLRFNPLESISFIVCAVGDDSVFAAGLKVVVWVPKPAWACGPVVMAIDVESLPRGGLAKRQVKVTQDPSLKLAAISLTKC
jgi:hypothetical protein